ncbi:hypothetical protein [Stutzerimonas xanthomarina]
MSESEKPNTQGQGKQDENTKADIPEHMKPENLEKLRDYGKDKIPPGIA